MSDELERLIAAERAAPPQPPADAAAAGWERLKRSAIVVVPPVFDVPPPVVETLAVAKTGAGLGIVGKVIATVAVATATTTTAIVVTRPEPARAPVVARANEAEPREPVAPTPAPAVAPAPVVEPPVVEPPVVEIATPPTPATVEIAAGERLRKTKPAATPAAPPPVVADGGRIERERELVSAAQRALAEKRPARALDILDDHARTFPHGAMAEDRDALRVVALCLAGRTADAETSRTKFFRRWPKSLHAARVRKACDEHG